MLDFAVNVRADEPPSWLVERLAARLADLGRYPSAADERRAVARRRRQARTGTDEVALLAGAAEGSRCCPTCVRGWPRSSRRRSPSPRRRWPRPGSRSTHVVLPPPFDLSGAVVPDEADLVVVGNPTNPTSVLHPREQILALRSPGRIVVVDEAFADAIPGEPASLAADSLPDVVVLRSLTKTWSLAGLRVGYALGARGRAGSVDRPARALAAGHAAAGGDRGVQLHRKRSPRRTKARDD